MNHRKATILDTNPEIMTDANSINAILGSLRKMPEFQNDAVAIQLGNCITKLENQILAICTYIETSQL